MSVLCSVAVEGYFFRCCRVFGRLGYASDMGEMGLGLSLYLGFVVVQGRYGFG